MPASWSSTSPRSTSTRRIAAAVELVADRLHEHYDRAARRQRSRAPRVIHGDEIRIRQMLFNLLEQRGELRAGRPARSCWPAARLEAASNSPCTTTGQACRRRCSTRVFRRFEPRTNGGRRRGAGPRPVRSSRASSSCMAARVAIETATDRGTTVICLLPVDPGRRARRGGVALRSVKRVLERYPAGRARRRRGLAQDHRRWRCAPAMCSR